VTDGNLGPNEQRKRLIFGAAALAGALGLAVAGVTSTVFQRVLLFALFWVATLGFFQAKEKT
jgi:tetrahydromethanopterin S-methyltransferase subunit C